MKRFASLLEDLERAGDAPARASALEHYFAAAPPADAAWAVFLLAGGRLRRALSLAQVRRWVAEACRLPIWLVEASIQAVGNSAETFSLLLPQHLPPPVLEKGAQVQAQQEMSFGGVNPVIRPDKISPSGRLTLAKLIEDRVLALVGMDRASQRAILWDTWSHLKGPERWLWHQLLAGSVHAEVSRKELVEALSLKAGLPLTLIENRLRSLEHPDARPDAGRKPGNRRQLARHLGAPTPPGDPDRTPFDSLSWIPTAEAYLGLLAPFDRSQDAPAPDPFCVTSNLEHEPCTLGEPEEWVCEWQWGGIRAQLIRYEQGSVLWTDAGEDITSACRDIVLASAGFPPGTALEGSVLAWAHGRPLATSQPPFVRERGQRQRGAPATPALVFVASDLLHFGGVDWRNEPLVRRRQQLERVLEMFLNLRAKPGDAAAGAPGPPEDLFLANSSNQSGPTRPEPVIRRSSLLPLGAWSAAEEHRRLARAHGAEGVLLKRAGSPYIQGGWLTWLAAPFVVEAILIGLRPAPEGVATARRTYSLAAWDGPKLVPIAQATCGLDPAEVKELEAFVEAHTETRFGPVRAVAPKLVLELAFAGIHRATRRRSGFQLDRPRVIRLRRDRTPEQASTLALLRSFLRP